MHRRRWRPRRPLGRVRPGVGRRRGHGARARRLLGRQERHRRAPVREAHPRLLPRALGRSPVRAPRRPRAGDDDGRRRPHDHRDRLRPLRRREAAELHRAARQARPVARREGHREGRHGRAQHEGRRAAAQGRPHHRHPRRRRRDRGERRHRRRGRAAAAQQRGRPGGRAAGQASRARLQGGHRAACGRHRGPLAPESGRGRRTVLHGRLHQGHDGRRLPLHQQGQHLAGHGRGHGRPAPPARRHRELAAPGRVQGAAPDPAAGRRRHRGGVLGAQRSPRAASARCRSSPATATWSPATPPA